MATRKKKVKKKASSGNNGVADLMKELFQVAITLRGSIVPAACKVLEMTHPAVNKNLRKLEEMNVVREITGRQRNRLYLYETYMAILSEGLEPATTE